MLRTEIFTSNLMVSLLLSLLVYMSSDQNDVGSQQKTNPHMG